MKGFYKSAMIITLLSAFFHGAAAQISVNGGWRDFGIMNPDTTVVMNCQELTTSNRSPLFYADFRQEDSICNSYINTWSLGISWTSYKFRQIRVHYPSVSK